MARIPLATDLVSRDGTLAKDGRVVNGYVEKQGEKLLVFSRPALDLVDQSFAGFGVGLFTTPRDPTTAYGITGSTLFSLASGAQPAFASSVSLPTGEKFLYLASLNGFLYGLGRGSGSNYSNLYRLSTITGTWTTISTSTGLSSTITDMKAFNGYLWVTDSSVSWNGTNTGIYYSQTGSSWTQVTGALSIAPYTPKRLVVHQGALWAFAGDGTAINTTLRAVTPTSGASWTNQGSWSTSHGNNCCVVSDGTYFYAFAGDNATNDIHRSTDGFTWGTAVGSTSQMLRNNVAAVSNNGALVMGSTASSLNNFQVSTNRGATWTTVLSGISTGGNNQSHGTVFNGLTIISVETTAAPGTLYYQTSESQTFSATSISTTVSNPNEVLASWAINDAGTTQFIKFDVIAYTFNGTSLTQVTDGQYPANTVRGAPYLNGIFYVMDTDGNIWGSAEDDPSSWTSSNLIVAEFEPDGGVCLAKIGENIVALGTYSTECFFDAGNATGSALSPVQSTPMLIGCAHANSFAQTESAGVWVAQQKAQGTTFHKGRFVVVSQGQSYKRISTPDIERVLDADNFSSVYADIVTTAGHMFYVLTMNNSSITLVYDFKESAWYQWKKGTAATSITITALSQSAGVATATATSHGLADGDPITVSGATQSGYNLTTNITRVDANTFTYPVDAATVTPATGSPVAANWTQGVFDLSTSCNFAGSQIAQFRSNGKVFRLMPTLTDDEGVPIDFQCITQKVDGGTVENKFLPRIELIGDKVDSVGLLRYSDDDYVTFSKYRRLDMDAERTALTRLGRFRRRTFQFRHTRSAALRLEALEPTIG